MFNDAHLPDTDAWAAMTRDLRQSKESRNALTKENSYVSAIDSGRTRMRAHSFLRQLKRRLAEIESEKEEYVPHVPFRGHLGGRHITVLLTIFVLTGGAQFYVDMA